MSLPEAVKAVQWVSEQKDGRWAGLWVPLPGQGIISGYWERKTSANTACLTQLSQNNHSISGKTNIKLGLGGKLANVSGSSKQDKGLILTFLLSVLLSIRSSHLPNTYRHFARQHCRLHKFLSIRALTPCPSRFSPSPRVLLPSSEYFPESDSSSQIQGWDFFSLREDSLRLQQFQECGYGTAKPQKKYEVNLLTKTMIYEEQLNRLCEVSFK